MSQHKEWNSWKKGPDGISWWPAVSNCVAQEALRDLEQAMWAFWESRVAKRTGPTGCFPRYNKKGRSRDSFQLTGAIHLQRRGVSLPRLGTVRLLEDAAWWLERIGNGLVRVSSAAISQGADRRFGSLAVEAERDIPTSPAAEDTIGVGLGVLALATLSDGTVICGPKALRRLCRTHSRKRKGSRNRARPAGWLDTTPR